MNNPFVEKYVHEVYVVIKKCENLPDFRTEKEKQKGAERTWQLIFHETEESLATGFENGETEVTWMCESFLTLKSSKKPFRMSVVDDKLQMAGDITLDITNLPIGDNKLLKPGRKYEGAREAYRNLQPLQKVILNSKTSIKPILSFWIWVLSFKEKESLSWMSNLGRLKDVSKSATNLFKSSSTVDLKIGDNEIKSENRNPFETGKVEKSLNPFDLHKMRPSKLQNHVGNSTFANIEVPKVRTSILIPRHSTINFKNPFTNLQRMSSLPDLDETKDKDYGVEEFKMDLYRQNLSFSVPYEELSDFNTLGLYFKMNSGKKEDGPATAASENFFSLLNSIQRKYAANIVKINHLESKNEQQKQEIKEIEDTFYKLKNKLINNNQYDMLLEN